MRKIKLVRFPFFLYAFLLFQNFTGSVFANQSEAEFMGFLSPILRDYRSVTNVKSVIKIDTVFFEKQESGEVTQEQVKIIYEYFHSQDLFRIKSLDVGSDSYDFDIAWNGRQFQFYEKADRMLTVSSNKTDGFGAVYPNTLLLPFEFIKPPLDTSESHHLLWSDLNNGQRLQDLNVNSTNMSRVPTEFHVKGGFYEEKPFFYKVTFTSHRSMVLPATIEWISGGGSVISKTIFEYAHSSSNCRSLPSRVERLGFSPDGTVAMQSVATIDSLDLNAVTNLGVFNIDREGVVTIFDSDSKIFVKNNKSRLFASRIMFFSIAAALTLGLFFWIQNNRHSKA